MKLRVFGSDWCRDCRRTKAQLDELGIAYEYLDVATDPALADEAETIAGRKNIPVVVYPDGSHQVEPSNAEVEAALKANGLL
ncbi:glutaredoxin family protein [Corynebacterium choanae]|uniref:Glutaredoxin n=1 Tax=Corynebacterium choanae TaxID=1862358 RepID=A0A3G6J459_9CORY|nr:glutaredoxin domain-containing protein [Corynebacterium choanae]AZA12719.1 Putative glutaredoxin [Corynebacterium choanae]